MFTRFEEYAATVMLGQPDSPPRNDGKLLFSHDWERTVFGMALALSKQGHFEWEDFRQQLIRTIAQWEDSMITQCEGQPRWDYYERFMLALIGTLQAAGVLDRDDLQSAPLSPHGRAIS